MGLVCLETLTLRPYRTGNHKNHVELTKVFVLVIALDLMKKLIELVLNADLDPIDEDYAIQQIKDSGLIKRLE